MISTPAPHSCVYPQTHPHPPSGTSGACARDTRVCTGVTLAQACVQVPVLARTHVWARVHATPAAFPATRSHTNSHTNSHACLGTLVCVQGRGAAAELGVSCQGQVKPWSQPGNERRGISRDFSALGTAAGSAGCAAGLVLGKKSKKWRFWFSSSSGMEGERFLLRFGVKRPQQSPRRPPPPGHIPPVPPQPPARAREPCPSLPHP